jgi:hypothetical protein
MYPAFRFDPPPGCEALRAEAREFIAEKLAAGLWAPNGDFGSHRSAAFSRRLGARGWIGMTWPRRYGGGERSMLERYVVTEELLAAGAPVGSHWIADRQSPPCCCAMAPRRSVWRFCRHLGNAFEREIPELVRLLIPGRRRAADDRLEEVLAETVLHAPSWTLRGGTREILRGIIARGLGLR